MAVLIESVSIAPNVVTLGQTITITVSAEDVSWGTIKQKFNSWETIKASVSNWKEVKNYVKK